MDPTVLVAIASAAGGVLVAATTGVFSLLSLRAQHTTPPPPSPAPDAVRRELGADEPLREQVEALVAALVQQHEEVEWWKDRALTCEAQRERGRVVKGTPPPFLLARDAPPTEGPPPT